MTEQIEITETHALKIIELLGHGLVNGVGKPEPGKMCVEAAVCYALGLPHGDDPGCVSAAVRKLKIRLNDSKWSSNQARAKGLERLALIQLGSKDAIDDKEFSKRVSVLAMQTCVPEAMRAAARICKDEAKKQLMLDTALACEKEPTKKNALACRDAADADAYAAAYAAAAADAAYAAADADAAYAAYAAAYAADADADAAAYAAAYAAAAADAAYAAAYAADAAYAAAAADAAYAAYAAAARDKSLSAFAEDVVQILIDMKAPGTKWLSLIKAQQVTVC